jgi:hypothetical protein
MNSVSSNPPGFGRRRVGRHSVGRRSSGRRSAAGSDRGVLLRWSSGLFVLIGALLLILGSCGSQSGPPSPGSDAAGSIGEPSVAASSSAAPSSPPLSAGDDPATDTPGNSPSAKPSSTGQPGNTASSKPAGSTPVASKPASSTVANKPATGATAPSKPRTSIVLPSFDTPPIKGPVLSASPPVSIAIPAINVQSPTQKLGLMKDGTIEVPPLEDTNATGWYTGSPAPGALGPSVILGHVDSAKNGPSVFYSLGTLKPGDEVSVNRGDGSVAVFKVDGVRQYGKDNFPTEVVYGNLNYAGLRLITCGGTFDPKSGHYESNIIAFASLVSSH